MFIWEAAPILLSRKGYATVVRRDCLALALWVIAETHANGEERLLSPQAKTRRQSTAGTTAPLPALLAAAPNLAAAYSAESLVVSGMDGGGVIVPPGTGGGGGGGQGGGGPPDVSSSGGGGSGDDSAGSRVASEKGDAGPSAAAVAIASEVSREQCRTAHLMLVCVASVVMDR